MAKDAGCSHTTISAAFSEPKTPRWGLLELIVEGLGGDVAAFHDLWLAASGTAVVTKVPRSLPADVLGFTGREAELAALDHLLESRSGSTAVVISALSGSGGVGKTALAVHWAHRVTDRFPDGQLYVNLRGYDPENPAKPAEALEALLRQLGDDGAAIPAGVADQAARLRTLLTGKRVLLLLDNAHSAGQVRDLLPGSPGCFVLVTTRDTLPALVARHGASRLTVGLLAVPEAVELLRRLAGPRVHAEPEAAEAIVLGCARLPLAIRIAAELAVARPQERLADLAAELPGRLDLLNAGDDEHTAIRSVFSWSLRHLSPAGAQAFALLGEHPGADIGPDAMAALLDEPDARRTIDSLVRAHLLEERERGRYGMHDLLRAYAAELAAKRPSDARQAARIRLFDYYLDTVRAEVAAAYDNPAVARQAAARGWLAAERANCLAIASAAVAESPAHTDGLAAALARYLDTGGHYREALALDALALRAAQERDDVRAETASLARLGVIHRRLGQYPEALDYLAQVLVRHRRIGDRAGIAQALLAIGGVQWRLGRYGEALDHLTESLSLHQEQQDQAGEAAALHNLGIVYRRLGRYGDAMAHYEKALTVQIALGHDAGQAGARNNLGIVQLRLGLYPVALANFGQALSIYEGLGDRAGEGAVRNNLGETFERLGRYAEAVAQHQLALGIHESTGYRAGHAVALRGLGVSAGQEGRHEAALSYLDEAIALSAEIGEADVKTRALIDAGLVLHELGDPATAGERLRTALELAEATDNTYERARALHALSKVEEGSQDYAVLARKLFEQLGVAEASSQA
jgi:tetratricopeptide (TPR) repeat protein